MQRKCHTVQIFGIHVLKTKACCDVFLLQLNMTFHLFVCALAGAGAAVIAMVR